jgi:cyclophilin family peptidyl-prolyl cis-trans isomerase
MLDVTTKTRRRDDARRILCTQTIFVSLAIFVSSWFRLSAQPVGPVIVVETSKGTFEFETYPNDAPKTVAHVVDLVRRGFYDGQRIHRTVPGFVVQWGDPRSRDPARDAEWGRGPDASSGTPLGTSEMPKKRLHTRGAVGLSHPGVASKADSQIYVMLGDHPELNGRYTVFGRVIAGEDVPDRLERGDLIRRVTVKQ